MASISKRGNSYRIKVSCGYDSKGKQVIQSKTWKPDPNMTPRQIEKELQRQAVLFEEECQGVGTVSNIKFEPLAKQWFKEYAEIKLRPRTLERYHQLEERTYAAIGHLKMDKITMRHLQKFIDNLSEKGINKRTGGGLAPKSVRHYLNFISDVFDYAIKNRIVKENPCRLVTLPELNRKEKDCYTLEEAQELIERLKSKAPMKYQAFFILAIYSGFRRGEMLGLEWKDIDFQTGIIKIERSSLYTAELGVYTDTTKTEGSKRMLKLPEAVMKLLKKYRKEQMIDRLKLGDQWHDYDRVFTKFNGEPMNPATPYGWLKKFCEKENIRFLGIHCFRHLNASLLISSGVDVKTVSAALGHSQTSTTLNIYAHSFATAQAQASEAIADALTFSDPKKKKA